MATLLHHQMSSFVTNHRPWESHLVHRFLVFSIGVLMLHSGVVGALVVDELLLSFDNLLFDGDL